MNRLKRNGIQLLLPPQVIRDFRSVRSKIRQALESNPKVTFEQAQQQVQQAAQLASGFSKP
jgi:hypothetical protein